VDSRRPADLLETRRPMSAAPTAVLNNQAAERVAQHGRANKVFVWTMAMVAVLALVVWPPSPSPDGKLTVYFLDVGQGDSALVVFPRGATMLVDGGGELNFGSPDAKSSLSAQASKYSGGGPSNGAIAREEQENYEGGAEDRFPDSAFHVGEAVVSRFLWSQHRRQLDYMLATHAHADHIGGLSYVARNFSVGEALIGRQPAQDPEYRRFDREVERANIPLAALKAGEQFEIQGVAVQVLWPGPLRGQTVTSGNDDSVVLRLVYGSQAILLAGDVEQQSEEQLVRSGDDLRADVLKVPHHGSKTSSTDLFLDAVRPRCAVISVGERSRFGHPHASVVSRYLQRGVRLFQTGRDGTVSVRTDGATLDVTTYSSH